MAAINDLVASFETELLALEQSLNAAVETAMERDFSSPELQNRVVARVDKILASITRIRAGTEPVNIRIIHASGATPEISVMVAAQDITVDDVEDYTNRLTLRNDAVVIEMLQYIFGEG